jgi:hypothetical protein
MRYLMILVLLLSGCGQETRPSGGGKPSSSTEAKKPSEAVEIPQPKDPTKEGY